MPWGFGFSYSTPVVVDQRPGVNQGRRRGITKPPVRKKRRKRR